MLEKLNSLETTALAEIAAAKTETELREIEVKFLGRKGELTGLLRGLKDLPAEQKGEVGKRTNEVKTSLAAAIEEKFAELEEAKFASLATDEWQDPTTRGLPPRRGTAHPITDFFAEVERVFRDLGFTIATGPEIEDDWHNFSGLNIPADHPARDGQDTLFLENDSAERLLRTQTSTVQIRWMEENEPPIRIVAPGRVYRKDDFDACHSPMFHQFEGLVVDRGITLANMKAVMNEAILRLVNPDLKFRYRAGHFPFVEPGLEVDMSCAACGGDGCPACKQAGWLEICGCGMVHPNVLKNVGIDPNEFSGFAFGFGTDRMVMMRHKISDIRLLYENDLRFLEQF